MAVALDRQGEGIGGVLVDAGLDRCRAEGAAVVWANSRIPAIPFYEAHGLRAEGDVEDRPTGDRVLPHRVVVLELRP
jgi:predicted N-acetyltransferase YhbS